MKKYKSTLFNLSIEKKPIIMTKEDVRYLLADWEEMKGKLTKEKFIDHLFHARERKD